MSTETKNRLRDRREPGHFWADNEIIDVFGDELGQNGISVYMTMTRFCYGAEVRLSLREIAAAARMSKDTVARSMKVLVALGLVIETKGARAKTVSTWALANVKALVQSYVRRSASQSVSRGDRLISAKTQESVSAARKSTLVEMMLGEKENCLMVRQSDSEADSVDKKICAAQDATDLSQNDTGFETDLSQSEGVHLYSKTQDSKQQDNNPLPPSSSKGEHFDESAKPAWERSACAAVQRVKRECDWSDRRLDPVIEEALRARCRKTGSADLMVCAETMIRGWAEYLKHKHLLRYHVGERKFITRGWWINDSAWPWDEKRLEQRRRL